MKKESVILRIFNLEEGEGKLVMLPIIYSFFIGASLAFFVTSSTSLFLNSFERDMLPVAFIAAGAIVWLIGQFYSYLQKSLDFTKVLTSGLAFLLFSVLAFLVFFLNSGSLVLIFILYAWIRVFAYLHAITFWSLAGRMFSLRQGKRVFGLITGGEVIASIISFFSIPFLLKIISTEELLYISGSTLFIGFLFLVFIVFRFKDKLSGKKETLKKQTEKKQKKTSFFENRYYKLFFVIAFLPIFAQFFVDFIFQAQAKVEFPQKESLTAFVGIFFGISSIVEFFLKSFISGRLLNKYGVKFGLLAFPVVLAFSFILASVTGLFYGAVALFFSFVTLGRLFTRAVRTSFNDPATQILYQPLPPNERLTFQNKIESGPKAYASIAAGIILFAFAKIPSFSLVYFSIFLLIIIAFWAKVAIEIYKEYKLILQKVLSGENKKDSTNKIELIFDLLINKINNSANETKNSFIRLFGAIFPFKLASIIENETEGVNQSEFKRYKLKELVEFSKSDQTYERAIAANGFSKHPTYKVERLLTNLLKDENYDVRCAAIISVGKMKATELYRYLLNNFRTFEYRDIVASAMINIGPGILYELNQYFRKIEYEPALQLKTIEIFEKIAGDKVVEILRSKINYPNKIVTNRVITALGNLNYEPNKLEEILLSQRLEDEIRNYVYAAAALNDFSSSDKNEDIIQAMMAEKKLKKEKVFALLSVIYDSFAIQLIRENLESKSAHSQGFAIEIADTVVDELHKKMLLPVFEDLSDIELLNKYKDLFIFERLSVKDRLIDIINSDYSVTGFYTKAVAIGQLYPYKINSVIRILKANLVHPNQLVREAAAITLFDKDEELFKEQVNRFAPKMPELKYLSLKIIKDEHKRSFLILEKLRLLKGFDMFNEIPDEQLSEFAKYSKEETINKNDTLTINQQNKSELHIPLAGEIVNLDTGEIVEPGTIISSLSNINTDDKMVLLAKEKTFLLKTNMYLLNNLLINNINFAEKYIDSI